MPRATISPRVLRETNPPGLLGVGLPARPNPGLETLGGLPVSAGAARFPGQSPPLSAGNLTKMNVAAYDISPLSSGLRSGTGKAYTGCSDLTPICRQYNHEQT